MTLVLQKLLFKKEKVGDTKDLPSIEIHLEKMSVIIVHGSHLHPQPYAIVGAS